MIKAHHWTYFMRDFKNYYESRTILHSSANTGNIPHRKERVGEKGENTPLYCTSVLKRKGR